MMLGYIANYGYTDGSGDWYLTLDTEKCDGCGECVKACPENVLEMVTDEMEPLEEKIIVAVREEYRKRIKYVCGACISTSDLGKPRCQIACEKGAITHSWLQ